MNKTSLIILGATRQVGKDTLCQRFMELDPRFRRFAFADRLKNDLTPFVQSAFGLYLPTCSLAEKELLRPILIAYGVAQRAIDPDHWVKKLWTEIEAQKDYHPNFIPVICDGRFPNEIKYFRQHYPGQVVYIHVNRTGAPPPTEEEEKHWKWMALQADFTLDWGNNSEEEQREIARGLLEKLP